MITTVITGILLPFFGTALGSSAVIFMKKNSRAAFTDCLSGFAGGVMLAASVWSLLLPALEKSEVLGNLSFLPAAIGFGAGIIFMILSERFFDRLVSFGKYPSVKRNFITAFAVTIHNIPEGMAVGMVYALLLSEESSVAVAGALSLSLGIAIQNIPEGAIVSLPLFTSSDSKIKSFFYGVASGAVEPVAAIVSILFVSLFTPLLPYFLAFAAGTMVYVVMNELSEEMKGEKGRGMMFFTLGFIIMMSLDVALG